MCSTVTSRSTACSTARVKHSRDFKQAFSRANSVLAAEVHLLHGERARGEGADVEWKSGKILGVPVRAAPPVSRASRKRTALSADPTWSGFWDQGPQALSNFSEAGPHRFSRARRFPEGARGDVLLHRAEVERGVSRRCCSGEETTDYFTKFENQKTRTPEFVEVHRRIRHRGDLRATQNLVVATTLLGCLRNSKATSWDTATTSTTSGRFPSA